MSTQNTVEQIPYAGKSSFVLDHAIKRSIQYLKNIGMPNQIKNIPSSYPAIPGLLSVDIAVRAKLLKAHLEDAFATNRFSVKITRRKSSPVLNIIHDSLSSEMVTKIIQLYLDNTTKYTVTKL